MSTDIQGRLQAYYLSLATDRTSPKVVGLECISVGWESDVYSFTLEQGPTQGRERRGMILRIYSGEQSHSRSEREFQGLRKLHQAEYPVPEVTILERENSPFDGPFIIMEKIEGDLLAPKMGRLNDSNTKQEMVTLFCRLMLRLHKLDWRPFVDNAAEYESEDPFKFIDRELKRRRGHCERYSASGFLPILEWLEERRDLVPCSGPALLHQDFHPTNILVTKEGSPYVIDWGQLDVSDVRFDLAWTMLLLRMHQGLNSRQNPILETYERLAAAKVEQIEYFDVFAILRRLSGLAVLITVGPKESGMRPEAVEKAKQHIRIGAIQKAYDLLLDRTGIPVPAFEGLAAL